MPNYRDPEGLGVNGGGSQRESEWIYRERREEENELSLGIFVYGKLMRLGDDFEINSSFMTTLPFCL